MDELWARVVENTAARVTGPLHLRLILQPVMASIFAIIAARADVREGKPPYLWSVFSDPAHRADLLRDGWKGVGKVFILAMILDAFFQWRVLGTVYPAGVLAVAFTLAIVPYVLVRGVANRLMR